ncbi:MAG: rhomboid family intramembrane serine protease, partial [Bdellovibrionia bacterium]
VIDEYGFLTSEPWRHYGVTFISHFFLHSNLFHLLSNMYFFLIFADNVELHCGRIKFLLLLILATLVGSWFELIGYQGQTVLGIGASGGVFGVVTFYLCRFTKQMFGMFLFGRWLQVPALYLFVLFAVVQVLGVAFLNDGVSYWAHLGGMLVGVSFGIKRS